MGQSAVEFGKVCGADDFPRVGELVVVLCLGLDDEGCVVIITFIIIVVL